MMTNQLPEGQWIRFAMMGEQPGKVHGLAGGLIQKPTPFDHPDAAGELYWGGVAGTQWWISPKHNMAGVMMAQRQMAFVHPFSFEFKRLAYETVKQTPKGCARRPDIHLSSPANAGDPVSQRRWLIKPQNTAAYWIPRLRGRMTAEATARDEQLTPPSKPPGCVRHAWPDTAPCRRA